MSDKPYGQPSGIPLEGRDGEVWRLYTEERKTQAAIARQLNLSQQRISQIIRSVVDSIPTDQRQEMRERAGDFYEYLTRRALAIADMKPAPVFVGKDGDVARDPETLGEDERPIVVRDYAAQLNALKTAAAFQDQARKLFGLDDPTKTETSATIRHELIGVDIDDLQ